MAVLRQPALMVSISLHATAEQAGVAAVLDKCAEIWISANWWIVAALCQPALTVTINIHATAGLAGVAAVLRRDVQLTHVMQVKHQYTGMLEHVQAT